MRRGSLMRRPHWLQISFVAPFALVALLLSSPVGAQGTANPLTGLGTRPEVGGTYRPREVLQPNITSSGNTEILRHRDFGGKPCLNVTGFARPFATSPNLFDHVISAENNCPKAIQMQVCYFKSSECTQVSVPGYGRKEAILGTMPSQKDFRFEFREKF